MKVAQSCLSFCDPMDCMSIGFSRPKYSSSLSLSRGSSQPRIEPRSPAFLADSLPAVYIWFHVAPLVAQTIKNLPAIQETWVQSLGEGDSLEKEMATHSRNLA